MADRVFATAGDWALASDNLQWILMKHRGGHWRAVWFVRSTRDILARGMRDKGCDVATADLLLSGLLDAFDPWKTSQTVSETAEEP